MRASFDCDHIFVNFKSWEAILFLLGCYLKEILEMLGSTWLKITKDYSADISNSVSSLFYYPFNSTIIRIIVFKLAIGYLFLLYFYFKYYGSKSLWFINIFWIYAIFIPSLDIFMSQMLKSVIYLLIKFGVVIFFFAVDPVHLDSLKLLLYDNLEIDVTTGRIYRTYKSKFCRKKAEKLLLSVLGIIFSSIAIMLFIKLIGNIINPSNKSESSPKTTPDDKTVNQQKIEERANSNWGGFIDVAIGSVIAAPIIEEFVYRRCTMKIGKYKGWTVFVSAFIFGLIHLNEEEGVKHIVPYMIPGVVFGMALYVSRNIWHSIFAHSAFNLLTLFSILIRTKLGW